MDGASLGFPRIVGNSSGTDDTERQRILENAREEFIIHGFRRAAVSDIARRSGVSRPTVYRRCGEKDDIIRAVVLNEVLSFVSRIADKVMPLPAPSDRVVEAFVFGMRDARQNPLLATVLELEPGKITALITSLSQNSISSLSHPFAFMLTSESLPLEAALRASELLIRITATLLVAPTEALPVDTDEHARSFAKIYLVPMLAAAAAQ